MKRRAVRHVTGWLLGSGCADWALNTACQTLIDEDIDQWQEFLIVATSPGHDSAIWCRTVGVQHVISSRLERSGVPHFTIPVAAILAEEMFLQMLEYLFEPDDFDADHPAPVDIVDCETL